MNQVGWEKREKNVFRRRFLPFFFESQKFQEMELVFPSPSDHHRVQGTIFHFKNVCRYNINLAKEKQFGSGISDLFEFVKTFISYYLTV